jgi:hypothetical protein
MRASTFPISRDRALLHLTGTFDYASGLYRPAAVHEPHRVHGNLYLYYILNEQRDLFINACATATTDLSNGERDIDNALSGGVSGRVYGPFNGSVQFGYQERTERGGPDNGNVTTN